MTVIPVPCLSDNFAYLIPFGEGEAALIDAPEAEPILAALAERGLRLTELWVTHHHDDHVQGIDGLKARHEFSVAGNARDRKRLPALDLAFEPGDGVAIAGHPAAVIDVPGHTIGHVAFHVPDLRAAFTADSLMAMGCGRLFEGTPDMMWDSLSRLMGALGDEDVVYQGHDYMPTNLRFARRNAPATPALDERERRYRAAVDGGGSMPHETFGEERATNPFLRAGLEPVKEFLDMAGAPDAAVFAELRRRRDSFS